MARLHRWLVLLLLAMCCLLPYDAVAGNSIEQASQAYALGQYAEAATYYEQVVEEYPSHVDALLGLARSYSEQHSWQAAVDVYYRLTVLGPVASETRQEYGDALREAGRLDLAVEQYGYVLDGAPGDELLRQAVSADEAGDIMAALGMYAQVVEQYSGHAFSWRRLAELNTSISLWAEACAAYDSLIALGPVSSDTHQDYGDALRESGRLDLAVEQYNKALLANSDSSLFTPVAAPVVAEIEKPMPIATAAVASTPSPAESIAAVGLPIESLPAVVESVSIAAPSHAKENGIIAAVPPHTVTIATAPAPTPSTNSGGYAETQFSDPVVMFAETQPTNAASGVMNFSSVVTDEKPTEEATSGEVDWLAEARRRGEGGYWEEAVSAYQKHMAQAHVDNALRLEYANALREARMLDEAMDEFNRVLHADAENLDAKLGVAKVLALEGNLEDAMLLLEQLYADAETGKRAQLTMAYCYFVNGYLNEAFSDIGEVLIRFPENREAVDLILAGHSSTVAGWDEIHAMLAKYPENDEALALLDEMVDSQKQLYMSGPVGPENRAEVLFQSGEYELSRREYEAILRKDPKNIRAWRTLGTLYTWEEDWEEAISAYESYLGEVPNDAEAKLRYAQVLLWGGYPEDARSELESLLSDVDVPIDTYEAALVVYAQTLNAAGERERALEIYDEALMYNRSNINARLGLADTLAGMQRYDEAIAQYQLILDNDPTYEAAKLGLARTYGWKGDLKKAQELYDRIYADGGHYVASRVGKAYAYMWQGKREKARELAEEAARLNPNNPDVDVLLSHLSEVAEPVIATQFRQSHDSDDNDYVGIITTASVPLTSEGSRFSITHEDFKLDSTKRNEESAGTHTKASIGVPLSERTRVQGTIGYLDIDNGLNLGAKEWTWAASFTTDLSDRATVGLGYGSNVFYDTSWLARTGIRLRETVLSSDFDLSGDGSLHLLAHYGHGNLSDGNSRNTWSLNLRRTLRERGVGRLNYGIAHRSLAYAQDLENGYWDPSDYYYSEVYADWLDLSDRWLRFDAGAGYGWDEKTGYGSNGLFRYNAGLRAYVGDFVLRSGYKSTEAPTTSTTTPGYEYQSWYLTGEYHF